MTCENCWYSVGNLFDSVKRCIHPKSVYFDQVVEKTFDCPEFIDRSLPFPDEEAKKIFDARAGRIGRFDRMRDKPVT